MNNIIITKKIVIKRKKGKFLSTYYINNENIMIDMKYNILCLDLKL